MKVGTTRVWASLLAVGAMLSPSALAADAGKVVVASYGGSFQEAQRKAFFHPYTMATGTQVVAATGSSHAAVKAMVDRGNIEWDVISTESAAYEGEVKDDLLEPLDYAVIKADGIPAPLRRKHAIGYMKYSQNLAWSRERFRQGLTPAQFFDPNVKARRVLSEGPSGILEFALMADGVKPNALYPLDVDRALKVIDRVKHEIVGFKSASEIQSLIERREIDAALIPNGRLLSANRAGAHWAYSWDAAVTDVEYWAVVKGSRNTAAAMKFIHFAVQPKQQLALPGYIFYGPTNQDAFKLLDESIFSAVAPDLPGAPANEKRGVTLDSKWWADNLEAVSARWKQYLKQ